VVITTDIDPQGRAICIPRCTHMNVRTQAACLGMSVVVAATAVRVPRRGLKAIPVVFGQIHLGAARCAASA